MRIQTIVPTLALIIALTWGAGPGLSRSATNEPRPTITLLVVNEGGVAPQSFALAKKEAVRIFAHSGIDLIWLDCESGRAEWGSADPCQRNFGPAEFWIRIVTRRPSAASANMLGFSDLDESQSSSSAGIYYPAAVELAEKWSARVGEILGAAIAHEVGHLILGANAHSPSGVMYAQWGPEQVKLIGISELNFTRDQAKLLQARIGRLLSSTVAACKTGH